MMLKAVHTLLAPLRVRVANLVASAVVQAVDNARGLAALQVGVLAGEDVDDVQLYQPYGFSAVPPIGAEAVIVCPAGDRGRTIAVVATERSTRPIDQDDGEVMIYHPSGSSVRLRANGDVEVIPGSSGKVRAGSASASLAAATNQDLERLYDAIKGAATVPNDGGAAFKANIVTAIGAFPGFPVGATKVNLE